MKLLKKLSPVFFVILFLVQMISAQKTWEKDWQKWKADDAYKIINDSPWARKYDNIDLNIRFSFINKDAFSSSNQSIANPPVVLRLYSSLKIRQALLRLRQIQADYDKMDSKQKSEFDEKTKGFLECENCKNFYVFILLQPVSDPKTKSVIGYGFKDEQLSTLTDKIVLYNDNKEKRELTQFIAPKTAADAAILYFPVMDEDKKPLITAETKKITVKFKTNLFKTESYLEDVEFDVAKMLIDGKLDF